MGLFGYGFYSEKWLTFLGIGLFIGFPILNELFLNTVALCQSEVNAAATRAKFEKVANDGLFPIVYSPGYNITAGGFEKCHPFDSTKYRRIWDFLFQKQILDSSTMKFYETSGLPSRKWLSDVMTKWYLFCHNYAIMVCMYVELPLFFLPGWFLRS